MIKILINAYACCPGMGSEPGMSWNFICRLSKVAEIFVITESEFEEENKKVESDSLHFYFVPVGDNEEDSKKIRSMCWNQGTWSFYPKYKKWQEKALVVAEKIIVEHEIDIMHQLNMAGFREPGMLYKINEKRITEKKTPIPLVWGPMTGYGSIPFKFMIPGGIKFTSFFLLKNFLNELQLRYHHRVRKMVMCADKLIAATPDMKLGIQKVYGKDVEHINETGTFCNIHNSDFEEAAVAKENNKFKILWVGRFIYTKQLELALNTIQKLRDIVGLEFHIVGQGFTEIETEHMHSRAEELGISELCEWHGQIQNSEVHKLMKECDVFFFTSIFEATSTVILEAISNHLPIVCFDRCGFGPIVDEKIGRKITCKSPKQAVSDFAKELRYLYENPKKRLQMAENCKEKQLSLSWDRKIERLLSVYEELRNK